MADNMAQEGAPVPHSRRDFLRLLGGAGLAALATEELIRNRSAIGGLINSTGEEVERIQSRKTHGTSEKPQWNDLANSEFGVVHGNELQQLYDSSRSSQTENHTHMSFPSEEAGIKSQAGIKISRFTFVNGGIPYGEQFHSARNAMGITGLAPGSIITSPVEGKAFLVMIAMSARNKDPRVSERRTSTLRYTSLWIFHDDGNGPHRLGLDVLGGEPIEGIDIPPPPQYGALVGGLDIKPGQPLLRLPQDLELARRTGLSAGTEIGDVMLVDSFDEPKNLPPNIEFVRTPTGAIAISSA